MERPGHPVSENQEAVAQAFVAARREGRALADYPGTQPAGLADAYEIQSRAIQLDGRSIAGWKVGRIPSPRAEELGVDRLVGPIFADTVVEAPGGELIDMPVFAGGFAAVEAELMLHIATPPTGDPMKMDDAAILALVDRAHVGIEIASSPFSGINALGALVTASDFGNNAGMILGPALEGWRTRDLRGLRARVEIDGVVQGEGDMSGLPGGPLGSTRILLANLRERGLLGTIPFWVSAGAITGVHEIAVGSSAEALFDGALVVRCRVVQAQARR